MGRVVWDGRPREHRQRRVSCLDRARDLREESYDPSTRQGRVFEQSIPCINNNWG